MSRDKALSKVIHDAVEADGWGAGIGAGQGFSVRDYKDVVVRLATTGTTTATIKFAGSTQDATPTFSSTQSASNHWDYVASYDLNDPSSVIVGDTGVALSGADTVATYIINTDGLDWVNAEISGYSAGTITVELSAYND